MNTDLFIGNLDRSVTSTDLEQLFSRHGRVQRAQVVLDKATGASKGFAFVSFATPEEAAQAISQLNGFDWNGRTLGVSYARPREAAGRGGHGMRTSASPPTAPR